MNRFSLTFIALGLVAATGCTDLEPSTGTETLALEAACTPGVQFDGAWPTIGTWSGVAPQPISANQYFLITPIDANQKNFLVVQADWENGKIGWAAKISRSQRAKVMSTLSLQPGSIDALGGTRGSIKWPPGTEEGQWVMDRGLASYGLTPPAFP